MKLRRWLGRLGSTKWSGWPERAYQKGSYQQRLSAVQQSLAECLDMAPHGSVRIISICAGDGRDVIGVLQSHKRRNDVSAWLVELDRQSVTAGVQHSKSVGLENTVTFLNEDATDNATYRNIAPADIVLACGVWGHVIPHERVNLVHSLTSLCKPGGTVIWSRGLSKGEDRLDEIDSLFADPTWEKIGLTLTPGNKWAVATHRHCGPANELPASGRLFRFKRFAG